MHSHAAAALINFCEGVERDVLAPYVDAVVERLVRLMMGQSGAKFVQEQAITTLAMVADASERGFVKVRPTCYHSIWLSRMIGAALPDTNATFTQRSAKSTSQFHNAE